jgi:glycerol-3-phosphate dehydrogenase (NAD(P)+)
MQASRTNQRYLGDAPFPDALTVSSDLEQTLDGVQDILIVVPSHAFHGILDKIKPLIQPDARVISATKGLDPGTGDLLIHSANEVLGEHPFAVLSGPNFAKELAHDLPTATTIACQDPAFLADLVRRFNNDRFRVYGSDDLIGVQLGGAVKNIIAVGAGMADGIGFGANARTALITRGIAELTRLGIALGGKESTFKGLACLGDLVLTCTDDQSRNRRFGLAIGQGMTIEEAEQSIGQVVEAVRNTKEVHELSHRMGIEMPICDAIYAILYEGVPPKQAAHNLLTRDLKFEEY